MTSDEMIPGRCNAETNGGYCEAYPVKDDDGEPVNGRCYNHGGVVGDDVGAPEGNGNSQKHGLYAEPGKLYGRLDDDERAIVDNLADALLDRVRDVRGEVDSFDRYIARRLGLRLIQQRLAEDYMAEESAETGNPLVERTHVSGEDGVVEIERPARMIRALDRISSETRHWLRDLGLLDDPTSKQADAARDEVELWRSLIEGGEDDE